MRSMDALPAEITEKLDAVRALCEKYSVKRLTLFGSAVKGTFDPERSDVDFAVELFPVVDPVTEGRRYLEFWKSLEQLFERRVDLVELAAIENPYIASSIRHALYEVYEAA